MEVRECHARRCIEMLSDGDAEIGIIRFREGYENYFQEVATASKLTFKLLSSYDDKILMHKSHPLAGCDKIKADMLADKTFVDALREEGLRAVCWGIFTDELGLAMAAAGVDALTCNHAVALREKVFCSMQNKTLCS